MFHRLFVQVHSVKPHPEPLALYLTSTHTACFRDMFHSQHPTALVNLPTQVLCQGRVYMSAGSPTLQTDSDPFVLTPTHLARCRDMFHSQHPAAHPRTSV